MASGRKRVLVAEDNMVNQQLMQRILTGMDLDIDIANDGQEAVDFFAVNSYDLVLMDIQMPRKDGMEATRAIRDMEQEAGKDPIAIVAVTANAIAGDRERFLAVGMNDYLAKPYRPGELRAVVERWL